MVPGADPKVYAEVADIAKLQPAVEEYLNDYNAESKQPMRLVLFMDALEHVSRIARIIRQPGGNALLLGVGGSGRQSLSRLATYMAGYALFTLEISKGYGKNEWREDLKKILMKAGIEEKPTGARAGRAAGRARWRAMRRWCCARLDMPLARG
jgi:dynein heavy chain